MKHTIKGPYYPIGETEWTCSCGLVAELIDPSKYGSRVFRREDFRCPEELDWTVDYSYDREDILREKYLEDV